MNNTKIQTLLYKNAFEIVYGARTNAWTSISQWLFYENIKHSKGLPAKEFIRDFQLGRDSF